MKFSRIVLSCLFSTSPNDAFAPIKVQRKPDNARCNQTPMRLKMAAYPTLEDWNLSASGCIKGIITASPSSAFTDGDLIETSKVVTNRSSIVEGTVIETLSGSRYILGTKKDGITSTVRRFDNKFEPSPPKEPPNREINPAPFGIAGKLVTKGADHGKGTSPPSSTKPSKKRKRPAPFGSVGKGITRGSGRDVGKPSTPTNSVPVLNQWIVNNRDQVTGQISGSPFPNEKDGKKFTTAEVATNMYFVQEGFTVITIDDRKFLLGEPKGGSKKDYIDEMVDYVTPTLNNWDVDDDLKITGVVKGSKNINLPDGTLLTTDSVISDTEFIDNGFTICTQSGLMYKLGYRQRVRKSQPTTFTSSFTVKDSTSFSPFNFIRSNKETEDCGSVNIQKRSVTKFANIKVQTLEDWTINRHNELVGIVDGEVLTTNILEDNFQNIRSGDAVLTGNGSKYVLGTKKVVEIPVLRRPSPILASIWSIAFAIFGILLNILVGE